MNMFNRCRTYGLLADARHRNVVAATMTVFLYAFGGAGHDVLADDATEVVIESIAGQVMLSSGQRSLEVKAGKVVPLPLAVETGPAGSITLKQGRTRIAVAGGSEAEIQDTKRRGTPIERVIQKNGSIYYEIAPRDKNRMSVETPFLVAVIKGTQFNIVVDERSATVALFEGKLEIVSEAESVDLLPGEVATRSDTSASISRLSPLTPASLTRRGDDGAGNDVPVDSQSDATSLLEQDLVELNSDLENGPLVAAGDDDLDDGSDDGLDDGVDDGLDDGGDDGSDDSGDDGGFDDDDDGGGDDGGFDDDDDDDDGGDDFDDSDDDGFGDSDDSDESDDSDDD